MRKRIVISALLLASLAAASALSAQDTIPKQASMIVLKDTFQFVPGTWAEYTVFDKEKNEPSRFYIAALKRETVGGQSGIWLEIEAEMKDSPLVITDIFAEETKDGPGKIFKAVIQVKGMSPFIVPKKYLEGEDQAVGTYETAQIVKRLEQKKIVHKGRTIDTLLVEAQDKEGRKTTAIISVQIPPIAIYAAETDDVRMMLNDWGVGAGTRIEGEPIGFFFWLLEQIADGLVKKK
ncbi:MAG: hypothetical protein NTW38_13260 [Candidatus Aminicenantes bacterium]|nr:hypothetical protein [Candidatus Aminicenantes bacterium]